MPCLFCLFRFLVLQFFHRLAAYGVDVVKLVIILHFAGQVVVFQLAGDQIVYGGIDHHKYRHAHQQTHKSEQAAEELKLTADDALALGVVESVIPEAGLGEPEFYDALSQRLMREIDALTEMPIQELLSARYARFRRFGGEAQR